MKSCLLPFDGDYIIKNVNEYALLGMFITWRIGEVVDDDQEMFIGFEKKNNSEWCIVATISTPQYSENDGKIFIDDYEQESFAIDWFPLGEDWLDSVLYFSEGTIYFANNGRVLLNDTESLEERNKKLP